MRLQYCLQVSLADLIGNPVKIGSGPAAVPLMLSWKFQGRNAFGNIHGHCPNLWMGRPSKEGGKPEDLPVIPCNPLEGKKRIAPVDSGN